MHIEYYFNSAAAVEDYKPWLDPRVQAIRGVTATGLGAENDEVDEEDLIWKTRRIAYSIIAPILISVGILGNTLTIILLRNKKFKGVTYTFFKVLALGDVIGLFFCISFAHHLPHPATPNYSTAFWYAHLETFFINTAFSMSVLVVVLITIDRYFSVCRPTQFKRVHNEKYAKICLISALIISVIMWFPSCFVKSVTLSTECESYTFDDYPRNNDTEYYVACMERNKFGAPLYMIYSWMRQTIVTFIPIGVLVILNTLIIKSYIQVVRRRNDRANPNPQEGSRSDHGPFLKEDHNLIRMLYAIMISFFVTMLPTGVANAIYTEFLSSHLEYEIFRAVANDLEILNHAMNFYLYIMLSKPLRGTLREIYVTNYERIHKMFNKSSSSLSDDGSVKKPSSVCNDGKETPIADDGKNDVGPLSASKISVLSEGNFLVKSKLASENPVKNDYQERKASTGSFSETSSLHY